MTKAELFDKYDALVRELHQTYGMTTGWRCNINLVGLHGKRQELVAEIKQLREQILEIDMPC